MESEAVSPAPGGSPLGAFPIANGRTKFGVWAPKAKKLSVELIQRDGDNETVVASHPLERDEPGVFAGVVDDCHAGSLYRFKLDGNLGRPDPRSRFQPFGVHGPSQVIDSNSFQWNDEDWRGVQKRDLVIYEMHVGSFTQQGTYAGAIERLEALKQLGITAIELLPLAQTPGRWNWGYDGVNYFAPRNTFGTPDELKAFVDACHALQIAVINDVVYNHVGPEGNYLSEFGVYRSRKYGTPWGDAFHFDSPHVRQFVIDNLLFWLDEYHFDGLRLDAVHYMFDDQDKHILAEIKEQFLEYSKKLDRKIYLIGESNIYDPELVGDVAGGNPNYDAIWSDCLMHSIYAIGNPDIRLTDRNYVPTDVAETLEHAYVFTTPQGIRVTPELRKQNHPDNDRRYIESLIMALQTHDSVGNHPHGKRLHQLTSVEFQRAAAPLILLYPSIPMIFMGEEWATESPFPFFADFEDRKLRRAVDRGRREEYPHHDWNGTPLPSTTEAFHNTKWNADDLNHETFDWYRKLLAFRKSGIKDGWLNVANLTTQSDLASNVYRLIYAFGEKQIHICSRLDRQGRNAVTLDVGDNTILLDSRPDCVATRSLATEHCLIWCSRPWYPFPK
jgi:malto-oligosyltrehalose trehalohydrolase